MWCIPFWVTLTLTLTSELVSRFSYLEHIFFITNNFPQMCLMLDQFVWGIRHVTVTFLVSYLLVIDILMEEGQDR